MPFTSHLCAASLALPVFLTLSACGGNSNVSESPDHFHSDGSAIIPSPTDINAPHPDYDEPWAHSDKKPADNTLSVMTHQGETLRAYLWLPDNYQPNMTYKAVVMAHGCGGAHYKDEPHQWNSNFIAGKFKVWAKLLNEQSFLVLLVDSFTTRDQNKDVGDGVCETDYNQRPARIDPVSVRPADIAAGIQYLKQRSDVEANAVGVLGFSNGGTSALVLANHESLATASPQGKEWFNLPFADAYQATQIIALYPGCGLNGYNETTQGIFADTFVTYTDTHLYAADNDSELPANTLSLCGTLQGMDSGNGMEMVILENTDHQFDYHQHTQPNVKDVMDDILSRFSGM